MIVHTIPVGPMQNLTFVIADEKTRKGVIIDPSWDLDRVIKTVRDDNITIELIVNTHHHYDHTSGNKELAKTLNVPIAQHVDSELDHDRELRHGDTIEFGESSLKVFHTPGHSVDGICLLGDSKIFTGDTLFVGGIGRVDFPGGSSSILYKSLVDVFTNLDDDVVIYPGHDYGKTPSSTMGQERRTNPYLQPKTEKEFVELVG